MLKTTIEARKVSRREYRELEPTLRVELVNLQYDLREADFPVLVSFSGDDRPGVSEAIDFLHGWMDARYLETCVFIEPSQEERERPPFWRHWRALPPRGRIGVHASWDLTWIRRPTRETYDPEAVRSAHSAGHSLHPCLVADGALVLRFYFHLSKKQHRKRLEKKDWRLDRVDRELFRHYDDVLPLLARFVEAEDAAESPWIVLDSADREYRNLTVAQTILRAVSRRLESGRPKPAIVPVAPLPSPAALDEVDLAASLNRGDYRKRLDRLQARLSRLSRRARKKKQSMVLVFEGWDAAGKGGCIRRLTRAMAARDYVVSPIAAPTDEEKARHYLWRFWRHLPRAGRIRIVFDRSWYGQGAGGARRGLRARGRVATSLRRDQ